MSFIDKPSNEEYDEKENTKATRENRVTFVDNSEILIVFRALNVALVEEDDWIRHKNFSQMYLTLKNM